MSSKHDEFLRQSAELARSLGAPAGTFACIVVGGEAIPALGSVNGRNSGNSCIPGARLQRARAALKDAERRTK